jgi:hypothetical protein
MIIISGIEIKKENGVRIQTLQFILIQPRLSVVMSLMARAAFG